MESSFLTTVFLPLALFVIMLGMGLGLTPKDFQRILTEPKGVLLGLAAQLMGLPIIGWLLATVLPLTPELAVGVMILAAYDSPGSECLHGVFHGASNRFTTALCPHRRTNCRNYPCPNRIGDAAAPLHSTVCNHS